MKRKSLLKQLRPIHSIVRYTAFLTLGFCALGLGGCDRAGRDFAVRLLPGSRVLGEKDQGSGVKTMTYQGWLKLPGGEQLKALPDAKIWTPLKTSATGTSATLFAWQDGLTAANKPVRSWEGQWRDAQGNILFQAALYNPEEVKGDEAKANVALIRMPAPIMRKMQDRMKTMREDAQTTGTPKAASK